MAVPRDNGTIGQRLKKLEDWARAVKLMPSVTQSDVAPTAVVKSSVFYDASNGNAPSYYDGSTWVPVRDETIAVAQTTADAAQVTADEALAIVGTDGNAPSTSPDPEAFSGIESIILRWTPIANADRVTYKIHGSTTLGFTADPTTLIDTTADGQFTIKTMPGDPPADPADPDPRKLEYGTTYYFRIVASDDDGDAPQSLQAVGAIFQATGINIAADAITAANIVAGTLTGELFAATVLLAGTIKTGEAGQRVEIGTAVGITGYKPDGSLMVKFPTDGSEALFDGELIVRGATILGGLSVQSATNESTADSVWTLMRGIVSPTATPQLNVSTYDSLFFSTTSLSAAQKTDSDPAWGLGGPFDLVPSQVSCVEWRTTSGGYFIVHQNRPNGTRAWFFDENGDPFDRTGGGNYFGDLKDWEVTSSFEMTTSTGPKNGTYSMFRFMPGAGTDYYISAPAGINRYARTNTGQPPVIGHNGVDLFIAEVISPGALRIRYYVPDGSGGLLPAPTATLTSDPVFSSLTPLSTVSYNSAFDVSAARYLFSERNGGMARLIAASGTALIPGGAASWAAADKDEESFECPTTLRRGMCWDGTNFWTYSPDGRLYKHTSERWDPAVTSSTIWAEQTFYDSDATGGTHETTPGVAKSWTYKRRSKITFTPPDIPDNGGTNDPDNVRLYVGRGSTKPANANFHLQNTVSAPFDFQTLATVTASPPTVNGFPSANPAKFTNDNGELIIDGTALIQGAIVREGADRMQIKSPKSWWTITSFSVPNGTGNQNITAWVTGAITNSSEITIASGTTVTVTRAGLYRISCGLTYAANATGARYMTAFTPADVPLISDQAMAAPAGRLTTAQSSQIVPLAAGATFRITGSQTSGGALALVAGPAFSFLQVEYLGTA